MVANIILFFVMLQLSADINVSANVQLREHICRYYRRIPVCCEGWRNGLQGKCIIPVCAGNCGDRGQCVRPNTCRCADQRFKFSCDEEYQEQMQSDQAYDYCPENCNGRGTCVNKKCECRLGYGGPTCDVELRGACYAKLNRGLCTQPIRDDIRQEYGRVTEMTMEVCCNGFGVAWGQPCQKCGRTTCSKGYTYSKNSCQDINECEVRGICQGGSCLNFEGSYKCQCPHGYTFDETSLSCHYSPDPCGEDQEKCGPGGKCMNLPNGDFSCQCHWSYILAKDKRSCLARTALSVNLCSIYGSLVCKNGRCIARGNSYECACNPGYHSSLDRKTCLYNIDLCRLYRGGLCQNGQCVSHGRNFYCICNPGFIPSYDNRRCLDAAVEALTGRHYNRVLPAPVQNLQDDRSYRISDSNNLQNDAPVADDLGTSSQRVAVRCDDCPYGCVSRSSSQKACRCADERKQPLADTGLCADTQYVISAELVRLNSVDPRSANLRVWLKRLSSATTVIQYPELGRILHLKNSVSISTSNIRQLKLSQCYNTPISMKGKLPFKNQEVNAILVACPVILN